MIASERDRLITTSAGDDVQRVQTYVSATTVVAVAGATAAALLLPRDEVDTATVGVLIALTLALVAAASLPIKLHSEEGHLLTLEEAVLLAMLVTVPLGFVPFLVMLATLLSEVRRAVDKSKLAFNTAVAGVGAGLAVMEMRLLEPITEQGLLPTLAVAAFGVAVASTVQLLLLAGLFSLLGRGPFRSHLGVAGFLDLAIGLNLALGGVVAAAIVADAWLAALAVILVIFVGLVLRGGTEPVATGTAAAQAPTG